MSCHANNERKYRILRQDLEAAAGELLVPLPEPGTDMAKVVTANKLLRDEIGRLRLSLAQTANELEAVRREYVPAHERAPGCEPDANGNTEFLELGPSRTAGDVYES